MRYLSRVFWEKKLKTALSRGFNTRMQTISWANCVLGKVVVRDSQAACPGTAKEVELDKT